jgi:hypothetical protein
VFGLGWRPGRLIFQWKMLRVPISIIDADSEKELLQDCLFGGEVKR